MKTISILVSIFFISACAPQKEEKIDHWDTPNLIFKKYNENEPVQVTQEFHKVVSSKDEFSFLFKGSEVSEKQKSIANVLIKSRCADDQELSKRFIEQEHSMGSTWKLSVYDLLPPQLILDRSASAYCQWTLFISNSHGSVRTYKLPTLRVDGSAPNTQLEIKEKRLKLVDTKNLDLIPRELDVKSFWAECDLIKFPAISSGNVYDILSQTSDDEEMRLKHPFQRCFFIANAGGKLIRSSSIDIYLLPHNRTEVTLNFTQVFMKDSFDGHIATATIKNDSDIPQRFDLISNGQAVLDYLIFSDRAGIAPDKLFYVTSSAQLALKIEGSWKNEVVVGPKRTETVQVIARYTPHPNCFWDSNYPVGGYRVRTPLPFLQVSFSYQDKRGAWIDLRLGEGVMNRNSPWDHFIRITHGNILNERVFYRQLLPYHTKREC